MAYDIATRLDTLGTRMQELNQNTATYSRTDDACIDTDITITSFTPEKVDIEQIAMHGLTLLTMKLLDVIFDLADLTTLDPAEPVEGDTFTWGTKVFTVMSIGEEVFTYTTSSRLRIRVHLKQTG